MSEAHLTGDVAMTKPARLHMEEFLLAVSLAVQLAADGAPVVPTAADAGTGIAVRSKTTTMGYQTKTQTAMKGDETRTGLLRG
jgi:hypothetical protein